MIKTLLTVALGLSLSFFDARGSSTINSTNKYAWAANAGWVDWHTDDPNGVSIGAYILSGYAYGANVGWINLGNGDPANHIQYQNDSAADFGVNFTIDPNNPAHGLLRGYAYGANIGWINFEATGNPYVILSNGQLSGYAYAANIGWINLGDGTFFVQTDRIDPGIDTDANGLPDAWEYTYFGHNSLDPNADTDGDFESNLAEYRAGTNPADPGSVTRSAKPLNIATRLKVLNGDKVLIGGFIITGSEAKTVLIRGIGPSLGAFGVPGVLGDTLLELHDASGTIASNDNWRDTQASAIQNTGIPPSDDLESAILQTLSPGAYTVILSGKNEGTGVGLVEVYDLATTGASTLANISTRGFVNTGDNVIIGGFIVGAGLGNNGAGSARVVIRAIGPSLANAGISNPLQDPTLEIHDGNGAIITSNDDWKDSQESLIQQSGLAPADAREAALIGVVPTGAYTAIVRGKNNGTGVGLIEVYNLP
jgi:hypothetical protein